MQKGHALRRICGLALTLLFASPSLLATDSYVAHAEGKLIEHLDAIARDRLQTLLDRGLMETARKLPLVEGQRSFDIHTRLVPYQRKLIIDLGGNAIPAHNGSELEDQQHQLSYAT